MRVTWNLWWRFGDWEARLDADLAVLRAAEPDVCGLQEVWAGPGGNAAELLAGELGMAWTWAPSPAPQRWQRRLGDERFGIGNAVLSRWPLLGCTSLRLPAGDEPDEGRTVLHARVDAPGGSVPFFTTQLNSPAHQSALRCAQASAVARFVAGRGGTAGPGHPPAVTGDLNADPCSDEVRLLGGHRTAPAVPGLVLVDAWRYADPSDPGWTWDPGNPHVRATGSPAPGSTTCTSGRPARVGQAGCARSGWSASGRSTACGRRTTRVCSPSWRRARALLPDGLGTGS